MTFDITSDAIQQLIEEKFADLHVHLSRAKSIEEREHLITDVEQYVHGMQDLFSCATPVAMPVHARSGSQLDEDIMIQAILDTALHTIRQLEEQAYRQDQEW